MPPKPSKTLPRASKRSRQVVDLSSDDSDPITVKSRKPLVEKESNALPRRAAKQARVSGYDNANVFAEATSDAAGPSSFDPDYKDTFAEYSEDDEEEGLAGEFNLDEDLYDEKTEEALIVEDDEDLELESFSDDEELDGQDYAGDAADALKDNDEEGEDLSVRIQRFKARLSYIIEAYAQMALTIDYDTACLSSSPITGAWWAFIRKVSPTFLVDYYLDAFSTRAKSILGKRSFGKDDLLKLPGNWKTWKSWGVYADIVTGSGVLNIAKYEVYVGGSAAKKGLCSRVRNYVSAKNGNQPIVGEHLKVVCKEDCELNLRLLATLPPFSTPRPYVFFLEKVLSVWLQTLQTSGDVFTYHAPPMSFLWTKACTPKDLPIALYTGLNRACQLKQGLFQPKGQRHCSRCQAKTSTTWFTATIGRPFFDVLCNNCYGRQRVSGRIRTVEDQLLLEAKRSNPLPMDNLCQHCGQDAGRMFEKHLNRFRTMIHFHMLTRKWVCPYCWSHRNKVTDELHPVARNRKLPFLTSSRPCDNCQTTISAKFSTVKGTWCCSKCQTRVRKTRAPSDSSTGPQKINGDRSTLTCPTPCMDCGTTTASAYSLAEPEDDPSRSQVAIRCVPCHRTYAKANPNRRSRAFNPWTLDARASGKGKQPDSEDKAGQPSFLDKAMPHPDSEDEGGDPSFLDKARQPKSAGAGARRSARLRKSSSKA
ncbi:MAG: hypothetical protein M1830_000469 [Pleopsidium flavum]|nr:MAG: hypothetical protein M1830_000469 [Pleopsidium flavum]